ncbi:hypothetical protein ACSU1N_06035 [Thermogladius sp. 4427co]|uniref:hypothetical protein n=1 Tax=Thermogladius sp. 4427co TaxID=3450718 RepID=UPI003F78BDAF
MRVVEYINVSDEFYNKVYIGSRKPLVRDLITATWVHDSDGLDDSNLPEATHDAKVGGVRFIRHPAIFFK